MIDDMDCKTIVEQELKYLHNIELLLRALCKLLNGELPSDLK